MCIIAATAIAAMVQLRHLRANNQINALLAIGEELSAQRFRAATSVIRDELPKLIDDPGFRAFNAARDGGGQYEPNPEYEKVRSAVNVRVQRLRRARYPREERHRG